MKTLKITFVAALFLTVLASCTKQDLNEEDMQVDTTRTEVPFTGGAVQD